MSGERSTTAVCETSQPGRLWVYAVRTSPFPLWIVNVNLVLWSMGKISIILWTFGRECFNIQSDMGRWIPGHSLVWSGGHLCLFWVNGMEMFWWCCVFLVKLFIKMLFQRNCEAFAPSKKMWHDYAARLEFVFCLDCREASSLNSSFYWKQGNLSILLGCFLP